MYRAPAGAHQQDDDEYLRAPAAPPLAAEPVPASTTARPLGPIDRSPAHRKQGVASSRLLRVQGGGRDAPRGDNPMKELIALVPAALPRGGIHPTEACL